MSMAYDKSLSHFDLDLKRGAQGEIFISDIMKTLEDGSAQIEVKTDFKFFDNMRFYIETDCRGRDGVWRPSGINVTRAQLWAIKLGTFPCSVIIETDWMRRAMAIAAGWPANLLTCDYGENPTKGVVVTWNHIKMARAA